MRSLTSPRAKRISGPQKFRSAIEKDFFNTIDPTRKSALRVSFTGQVIDTNPSLDEIYASVDTACRLRPSGTVNVSQPSKPFARTNGSATQAPDALFRSSKG